MHGYSYFDPEICHHHHSEYTPVAVDTGRRYVHPTLRGGVYENMGTQQ